jgi:hypothetical protein
MAGVYSKEFAFLFFLIYTEDGWSICERTIVADIPRRWLVNIQIGLFSPLSSLLKMALPMCRTKVLQVLIVRSE